MPHKRSQIVYEALDGMIESTEEFIGDDGLRADDERIHDLSALIRVRELFESTFAEGEDAIDPPDDQAHHNH